MKAPPGWFRRMMRVLSMVARPLAATIALRLFWSLGTPAPVRDPDRATHDQATVGSLTIRGARVVTYQWGDPDRPAVILVHGWRSRASRFSALTTALVAQGYCVVAFDAPGNGESTGTRTVIYDYVTAIRELAAQHHSVAAIVGHSFGAVAAAMAIRRGVTVHVLVTVAAAYDFDFIVRNFVEQVGLGRRAASTLRRRAAEVANEPGIRELVHGDIWTDIVARVDDLALPVLVMHDENDPSVPFSQSQAIAADHGSAATLVVTRGLGHSRILADEGVVATIVTRVVEAGQQ